MKLFFLFSLQVIPALFYFFFCYLLFRSVHDDCKCWSVRRLITLTSADITYYSLLFILIALSYVSDLVYMVVLGKAGDPSLQTNSVIKIYIFSSLLPFVMAKHLFNLFKYALCLYLTVAAIAVAVFLLNHHVIIYYALDGVTVLLRVAMLLCMDVMAAFVFAYLYTKEKNKDAMMASMTGGVRFYGVYFAFITTVFLFYCVIRSGVWDYILAIIGFLLIHILVTYNKIEKNITLPFTPYKIQEELVDEAMPVLEDEPFSDEDGVYKPALAALSIDQVKEKIVEFFEINKGFLRHDLSLETMAQEIGTNKTYLSYVINKDMNKKFRDLVKYYRVKEAIRIFNENPEISYKDLSKMCGFNNFASFSGAFKLYTGMPPGEWCRNSKKNVPHNKLKTK